MTPADRRVTELIDKWLASIDLHLKYVELSDAAYARAQAWPRHDRPTRWVLEVARQKILELKTQCENRQAMGDGRFCESLELMAFLANLVGIQHIQRFIPLADPQRTENTATVIAAGDATTVVKPILQRSRPGPVSDDATREMPRLKAAPAAKSAAPAAAPARREAAPAKAAAAAAPARPAAAPARAAAAKPAATAKVTPTADLKSKIIADAVRLLKWGKSWHELADLIERIGERPPAAEIRKVLRANKNEIETKAGS